MRPAKYVVDLTFEERSQLEAITRKGKSSARRQTRARVLLKADEGLRDDDVAEALGVCAMTVGRVRKRFVEEGVEAALKDKPRPGQRPKLSDKQCAHVIALACSEAPPGHAHWTLRLLAEKVVELEFADSFSHESVRQLLKKTSSNRGSRSNGVFPR